MTSSDMARRAVSGALIFGSLVPILMAEPTMPKPITNSSSPGMNIRLIFSGHTLTAKLDDHPSARDFLAQLPLTLVLEDYAATEKIANLPRRLTVQSAPAGFKPSAGDITYYAPWGNLAIFHKDFRYSDGLISLGRLEFGSELLKVPGPLKVIIEVAKSD